MDSNYQRSSACFRWIILMCSFINHMGTTGLILSLSVLYVSWLEEFHEGKATTSWIISFICFLMQGFCPVSASLCARYGFRAVAFVGALVTCLGLVTCSFATSVIFVIMTVGIVTGVGLSCCYLPGVAVVTLYFDKRRSLALGVATSGVGIGAFALAPVVDYLVDAYTWRGATFILGGITLNMCVTALLFVPVERQALGLDKHEDESTISVTEEEAGMHDFGSDLVLGNPTIRDEVPDDETEYENLSEPNIMKYEDEALLPVISPISLCNTRNEGVSNGEHQICNNVLKASIESSDINKRSLIKHIAAKKGLLDRDPQHKMHSSLNELQPKIAEVPHNSLPNLLHLRLRQKPERSEETLIRSLQHIDVPILASIRGLNYLFDGSKDLQSMLGSTQTWQHDNEKNESKEGSNRPKSWLSKLLSSPAIRSNVDILRDRRFLLFCLANFLACLSLFTPSIYMVDRAVHQGIDKSIGAILISTYGIGNVLGRLILGWFSDNCCTNRLLTFIVTLGTQGAGTMLSVLCGQMAALHGIYAFYMGFHMGVFSTLAPVVTVDLTGTTNITAAYGMLVSFMGTAALVGPPIAGWLYDWTQDYAMPYLACGLFLTTSGLILLPLLRRPRT